MAEVLEVFDAAGVTVDELAASHPDTVILRDATKAKRWWFHPDTDVEAADGMGRFVLTGDVAQAKQFDSYIDAIEWWRSVPANRPIRVGLDDKPNRPLTAFTVSPMTYRP